MSTYFTAMVINHKEIIPGVWKMELATPEIAKTARPGQFIQLYPSDERNLLARPISLSSISKESVTVVYRVVGQGTRQFSYLQVNDTLRVMEPLGITLIFLGLRAIGGVFQAPAIQAVVPAIVPKDQLIQANAWDQFLQSGALIIGPVLGAVMYASLPLPIILISDLAGAVIASIALMPVKIPHVARVGDHSMGFVTE